MEDLIEIHHLDELEQQLIQLIRMSGLDKSNELKLIEKCIIIRQKRKQIISFQLKEYKQQINENKQQNERIKLKEKEYHEDLLCKLKNYEQKSEEKLQRVEYQYETKIQVLESKLKLLQEQQIKIIEEQIHDKEIQLYNEMNNKYQLDIQK